jgi:tripartite-type tricarboxylate transporter receptor subunit TctC
MLKVKRNVWVVSLILSIFIFLPPFHSTALAAEYPTKTIELIIPWTPGSASDLAMRMIAKFAEKNLGQAIAPINMVGGNGAVAWSHASKAKPDGYTIAFITMDILTNQTMGSDVKYDSFDYLLQFTHQPMGLYVHEDSPYKTLQDLVNAAKAKPGEIKVGTHGLGAIFHQAAYLVERKYGVKFNIVPFKGSAEIVAAQLGKHVEAGSNTITLPAPHVKAGTLRMLLCFSGERLPDYPDVPSVKELGISDVEYESWRAVAVPKGVPAPVKAKLEAAFKKAYNDPEYQQLAKKSKYDLYYRTHDQLIKFLEKQYPMVREILKDLGYAK